MLIWYSSRTNEIYVKLKYEKTQLPLSSATVTVELLNKGTAVADTHAALTETSTPGTYSAKYPLLTDVAANRQYQIHIVVISGGNTVIDEVLDEPVFVK